MINLIITIIVLVLVLFIATKLFKSVFKIISFVILIVVLFAAISGYMVYSDYNTIKDNIGGDKYFVLYDEENEEYLSAFKMSKTLDIADMDDLITPRDEIKGLVNDAKNKDFDGFLFVIDKAYLLERDVPDTVEILGVEVMSVDYENSLESENDVVSTTTFAFLVKEGIEVNSKGFIKDVLKDKVKLYPRLKSVRLFNTIGAYR